jgi:hypothetical protein
MKKTDTNNRKVLYAVADVKHVLSKLIDAWEVESESPIADAERVHHIAQHLLKVIEDYQAALLHID